MMDKNRDIGVAYGKKKKLKKACTLCLNTQKVYCRLLGTVCDRVKGNG